MEIEVKQEFGHYVIYVDGKVYCTCDNQREVDEELEELKK